MADHAPDMAISITYGPGLRVPFAAVIGEFGVAGVPFSSAFDVITRLKPCLPGEFCERLAAQANVDGWPGWLARFAQAITEAQGKLELPAACGLLDPRDPLRGWVALGYQDAPATAQALHFALASTRHVLRHTEIDPALRQQAAAALGMQRRQPDFQARALMRAARLRGIPVYPVAGGSRVWQYGQGSRAWQCFETSTHADSRTGVALQRDKAQSNELVRRLGLPGVEHGVAMTPPQAAALANRLGYPLVVKPLNRGQGRGITVGVTTPDGVVTAFRKAVTYSRQVIVERFVPGNDHRIMVTGGKFQWAIQRNPPEVTGDGTSSITQLIDRKNARIAAEDIEKGYAKRVKLDDEVRRVLALGHMDMNDCPRAGEVIRLRANANVSTGGSFTDLTRQVHPDNKAMAETIARAFRLDSAGIDFLTSDIGRSWREGSCAVIEVNATPMLFCDAHAEQFIACKFAGGGNGRVPSLLLLCNTPADRSRLYARLDTPGHDVGIATRTHARLNGFERAFGATADAGQVVKALLFDPSCKAVVTICTLREIRQRGLPSDHFSAAAWLTDAEPDPALRGLLDSSCSHTGSTTENAVAETLSSLLRRTEEKSA